jgi:membrane-bound lytic murein transglycosylase D
MTFSVLRRMCTVGHRGLRVLILPAVLLAGCATTNVPAPAADAAPTPAPIAPAPAPSVTDASPVAASAPVAAASAATAAASAPADTEGAPAPTAVDPLRPGILLDFEDRSARIDLWDRVRHGFGMPDLDSNLVRDQERWYLSRPDYVQRMVERGSRYLFHIVEELERRHMPTELALLPFIESAYNPEAMSSARASGMWQFIPSTGRDYELKQNVFRDDRRDVLASTRAALDYLQKLYGMFDDWQLALAAYNWGEGNVQRAVARNRKAGRGTDYSSLKMPLETQLYLPKLQAVKNIIARPAEYGVVLPDLWNHPYFLSVPIERDIDVAVAAQLAGMSVDEFKTLNPQMNKPVILAAGTPQILLPYDNANRFVRRLPQHRGPLATWTAWVAPKTMRPADAAKATGMSEADLRDVNRIPARMLVKAGSTLLVPRVQGRGTDVAPHIADNAVMTLAPDAPALRRLALKAGRRDSVATVARRYRVSRTQVAEWNDVSASASFKPGQTVIVYVSARQVTKSRVSGHRTVRADRATKAPARKARRSRPSSSARQHRKGAKRSNPGTRSKKH